MKTSTLKMMAGALLIAGVGFAADEAGMTSKCQHRAATTLKISPGEVEVTYQGQRTDKTHAVNGSATVGGQERTFQCSFAPNGDRIARFVLDPAARASQPAHPALVREEAARERAVAGKFDATGRIPCAHHIGQPMGQCDFGVARAGGGTATVVVFRHDGMKRILYFSKGKATGADISQADGRVTFRVTKESDLFFIKVGQERYEIPEAVVFGG